MYIQWKLLVTLLLPLVLQIVQGMEFVHIKSSRYGQLVTSNTLKWSKPSHSKEPVTLPKSSSLICQLSDGRIGLVEEVGQCTVISHDGKENSSSYQTLSGHASRVIWSEWRRPNLPPTGAVVAHSPNPHRFIAYNPNSQELGYLDTKSNLGTCMFPSSPQSQCVILTEVEPVRYELRDIEFKKAKGFIEEPVILAESTLKFPSTSSSSGDSESDEDMTNDDDDADDNQSQQEELSLAKSRVEKVLSYKLNQYDYWGGGHLMAKGLHTSIKLVASKGSDRESHMKIIEWGIPFVASDKIVTVPVWEELEPGTGINITIKGIRRKGEMPYWATVRTIYKDGSYSTRHIEGQRKLDEIQDIHVEKSRRYYLKDGSLVPDPVTEPTTILTSSTLSLSHQNPTTITNKLEQQDMTSPHLSNGDDGGNLDSVEHLENLRSKASSSSSSTTIRYRLHDKILMVTTLISIILPIMSRTIRVSTFL